MTDECDAQARVIGLFADLGHADAVGIEHDPVIAFDATNFPKGRVHQGFFGEAKAQQVDVSGGAMRHSKPHVKEQRALEQEMVFAG